MAQISTMATASDRKIRRVDPSVMEALNFFWNRANLSPML